MDCDPDGIQKQLQRIIGGLTLWVEEDVFNSMLSRLRPGFKSQEEWEDVLEPWDMLQVCILHGRAADFGLVDAPDTPDQRSWNVTLENIKNTAAHSAIRRLVALQDQWAIIERLLTRFYEALIDIAKEALDTFAKGVPDTWNEKHELAFSRIAEACYMATDEDGELGHDLLYTQAQEWADFWRSVLHKCRRGPTLFEIQLQSLQEHGRMPPEVRHPAYDHPRYLFRVFDQHSNGKNDEDKVESQASVIGVKVATLGMHFSNIFDGTGTEMLVKHLNPCGERNFSNQKPDNLVSWTSSLLFAIQYAFHRHWRYHTRRADVKICMVDTTQFPQDQFVRDLHLIRAYDADYARCFEPDSRKFFDFRLAQKRYWNGEYLSQGLVTLAGRSCTTSLKNLESSGLYKLYPEFKHGWAHWTNRVLALRREWSERGFVTTTEEEKTALRMSESCFPGEMSKEVAWMLLCFKNRSRYQCKFHPSVKPIYV